MVHAAPSRLTRRATWRYVFVRAQRVEGQPAQRVRGPGPRIPAEPGRSATGLAPARRETDPWKAAFLSPMLFTGGAGI